MEEIGSYPDGRKLLTASPIWSGSFVAISVSCLALILFTTYIILRHFQTLGFSGTVLLAVFIGVQSFYQWWRAVIYLRKMRVLYATAGFEQSGDGSTLDIVFKACGPQYYRSALLPLWHGDSVPRPQRCASLPHRRLEMNVRHKQAAEIGT